MHQPPSEDPKKTRKPAIHPRQHLPGGPAGSPQHALTRLDEAERLERALLHELSGLLDGSTRFLRLAMRELRESPNSTVAAAAAINHLAGAESALNTMASMVERTRDVANDRPHPRYIVAPQPVHQAIDAAVAHTQQLAAERGIRIQTRIEVSALSVPPLPIYPVIANAIRNAIDAHPVPLPTNATPEITAAAWCEHTSLYIEIRDTGVGPSEELLRDPKLAFSLGYTERPGGSGIGLALSADIIASLGGTISLAPASPEGAVLKIVIPVSGQSSTEPEARSNA
ncbi:MAG: ATP-binding protein [Phycisphaerales bacterium JB050]